MDDCAKEKAELLRDLASEFATPGTELNNALVRSVTRYLATPSATTASLGQPLADELDARANALIAGGGP